MAHMEIAREKIEEIAAYLDTGMKCFYNKLTGEIKFLPDPDKSFFGDEYLWKDAIREIEDNRDKFVEFVGMEMHDSIRLMEDYTETVDDKELRRKLFLALGERKPLQNFKFLIDNSIKHRQKWFDFKKIQMIKWVQGQVDLFNTSPNQ
jgi:hypothetical protein